MRCLSVADNKAFETAVLSQCNDWGTTMKYLVSGAVLAATMLFGAASANAAAKLYAGYDGGYYDTSFFELVTDSYGLQNVQISGTNTNGTSVWTDLVGDFGANTDTGPVWFNNADFGAFQNDYDDYLSGEASYTITALYNGNSVSATFTPSLNASGGFVGFLGNDSNGNESDADVPATVVASLSGAVPEPSTWAMMLFGVGGVGAMLRRRTTAQAATA